MRWTFALLAACSFEHGRVGGGNAPSEAGIDTPADTFVAPIDAIDSPPPVTLREKAIEITGAVTGTHTSFPLWLVLDDQDLAARARADGTDIHFVSGTTPLDFQIQRWTQSSGHLEAWVRVPSLAMGTKLALRYGDVTAAHMPNAANTFTGYNAVWHLDDQLNNATVADARGTTTGTAIGLGPSDSVTGKLGRGIDFNDDGEQITFANPLTGNTPHTISAWVDQGTTASNDCIIALGTGGLTGAARWLHSRFNADEVAVGFYNNDWTGINHDIVGDGWVLVHWVFEGANRMSRFYVNGAQVAGPFQHGSTIDTTGTAGSIGNAPIAYGIDMGIAGALDEVRIINTVRSAAWIAAEALNQATPTLFYTVGPETTP